MKEVKYIGYPRGLANRIYVEWESGLQELQSLTPARELVEGEGVPLAAAQGKFSVVWREFCCTPCPGHVSRVLYGVVATGCEEK